MKCLICKKDFNRVCSHVRQKHEMSAREYKEHFGLNVKRGILSDEDRKTMRDHTFSNGTVKNLIKGKKNWFVKGDKKAGRYKRSEQTLSFLRELHKKTKVYKQHYEN